MWSAIIGYAKLAVCDGLAQKAPEMTNGQPRKACFEEESVKSVIMNTSTNKANSANELLRDGTENVKPLAFSIWGEQDHEEVCEDRSIRLKETIFVTNELVTFLKGGTARIIENSCNVEFQFLGGDKKKRLAITGHGNEREKAKSMILRLASSCLSSPCVTHLFMDDSVKKEFGAIAPHPLPVAPEVASEQGNGSIPTDFTAYRRKFAAKGWRNFVAENGRENGSKLER